MRLKNALTLLAASLALAIAVVGIGSGDLVIQGRDIVEADAGGGDLLGAGKGEGLHYGTQSRRYPFAVSAVTLKGVSTSSTDAGYLWVQCLNSSGDTQTDSVSIPPARSTSASWPASPARPGRRSGP